MNTLSAEALKLWLKLALNQSGFVCKLDVELSQSECEELLNKGFLYMKGSQQHFTQSGLECVSFSDSWLNVYEHYGAAGPTQREFEYVQGKLSEAGISEQLESFLCYWQGNFDTLDSSRPGTVRNALRYDCSKMRLWYLQAHFTFEIGDIIVTGKNGEQLRFHSDDYKSRIQAVLWKHNISEIPMQSYNLPFWNEGFAKGWYEIKPEAIAKILEQRNGKCP